MKIRFADKSDSLALLGIYAQYIDTTITFEYELPTEEEFARRISSFSSVYPYLVCEEGEKVAGYAYAHRMQERAAYQWNAELSIYLDREFTSKGLGEKLYCILIDILRMQGVHNVYGGVTIPNEKSEGLHQKLGFTRLGAYHNTGYKCGRWLDVVWYEKNIAPYEENPLPIKSIKELPENEVQYVIDKYFGNGNQ